MSEQSPAHGDQARQAVAALRAQDIDVVRVVYPDLLGADRARDILVSHLPTAARQGLAFCRAVYHTSPQSDTVPMPGGLSAGMPDISVRPDLDTLHGLPWEPGVAWCLGDALDPATGRPALESPRDLLRGVLDRCGEELHPVIGPELEYYLCERDEGAVTGWSPYGRSPGNVYSAGLRGDPDGHLLRTLRHLKELEIGVTAGNREFGSGQFEINLDHSPALDAADRAFRFKSAVKEIARTEGRLATFMARPFNEEGGSGFHLHLSMVDADGRNVFEGRGEGDPHGLSSAARHAIAGVLTHAPALTALLNPTVNSYKRFGPDSLAPWLIDWGLDNRSAMVRIPPERGSGTRLELRLGDATANPYLAVAGAIAAVGLGLREKREPPAPLDGYGYGQDTAARLPGTLTEALDALEGDTDLTGVLGAEFTHSFLTYKRNEIDRFQQYVTDWEFKEYAFLL
ncbi:glutamine synthetase [Streptomyces sp. CB02923]|uniref:glutamine synthetase family protein n=1 Tax=Streptomyces sp. CB02923 TaxID=1718985 RepID=UPI00093F1472|nr:glutamine synthetase family protein [Streptomyces sp. CB02923]OKI02245.1 glutamine synthetase [Streptomyces sp. CB02923]